MPPAVGPVLQPSSTTDPVSVGVNLSVTNWLPSKPLTCLSKLHCDLDRPEPRLGGAFEVAASRSRHLATLNGCKLVAYTVILKDEWTQAEAFAPPPGSGGCAFAFVHEESKLVTLHREGDQHPQQGRDATKEEAVAQAGIPKEADARKAAGQAMETAHAAAPSSITPYEGEAFCVNGILSSHKHGCCAASCGRCGGDDCDRLPGGGFECCPALFNLACSSPEEIACRVPPPLPSALPSPSPSALRPQQGRDATKEEAVAQAGIPKEADARKAAGQAMETAHAAAPSSITPYEGEAFCVNGILSSHKHGCCAASCGRCGGDDCDRLPGGGFECCPALFNLACSSPEEIACRVPPPLPSALPSALPPSPPVSVNLFKTHTGMDTWYKDRPARSTDCEWLCREDPRCVDYRFDVVHASCALFDAAAIMSLSLLAEPTRQAEPRPQARPQRLLQQEQKQANDWILVEVPRDDLPWPVDNYRRNSRVPKLLPHLFFPPTVDATVYIDAENSVTADLHVIVQSMLSSCNASFAAQTSPSRAVSVMKEFEVVRFSKNAVEPKACQKQERTYRADKAYMATVNEGRAVGINAELLVRRNLYPYNLLGNSWMRAYLRGGDRDQPAFSYAFEQSVMKPCRKQFEEESGADKTGYSKGQCGLACGTGFVNLVGSARSADCLGDSVKTYCENQPEGFCEVKPRPWWATQPPDWVCSSKL